MKYEVKSLDAKKAGDIELLDAVFGIEDVRADLLQRVVRWQLAKRQAGTHSTLGRSDINRTKAKFGRQKGGGRARHGARSAPQFVGGGKAHGPQVRDHSHNLPKKVRKLALAHALSSKVLAKSLIVLDKAEMKAPKTSDLRSKLAKLSAENALIITGADVDMALALSASNIPNVDVLPVQGVNVYDILRRDTLVLTKDAVDAIQARFADGDAAPHGAKPGDVDFIDDVVLIDGVGDKAARALAKAGAGALTKLAAMSAKDAAALFEQVGLAARAEREDWHGQAKAMVAGEAPRAKVDQRLLVKLRAQRAKVEAA